MENVEKRVYEFLPQPTLPKSLTRERAKDIMIDVNHRASEIYKDHMRDFMLDHFQQDGENCEPLIMEVFAYDLAFIDYKYNENIFRYAIHKYQL